MTTSFSLASVYAQLTSFANLENFWSLFNTAFGSSYDFATAASLRSQWQSGDFSFFPQIEVVSSDVLGGAKGAYGISTHRIYLSDQFVSRASEQSLDEVILEEFGHFVDAQVNATDTAGDEGELFSAVVLGKSLSDEVLQALKTEDDRQVIVVDGKAIAVEMAEPYDPTLVWVKQFGSSEEDKPWDIGIDSNNNIYVVGQTRGSLSDNNNLGFSDAFLTKYDASGNQLWVKQFGSSDSFDSDYALGITLDNDNNIYVTGYTFGSLPGNSNLGIIDAFLAKYDTNGNQLWIQQFGSTGAEIAQKVTVDGNGNIYVTGFTSGSFPNYNNLGSEDAYIAKYDADGNQLWVRQFGTSETDRSIDIGIDSNGDIYITGWSEGSLPGNSNFGGRDAYIAKYDADGNQLWIQQFGTSDLEESIGIKFDSSDNLYVTGPILRESGDHDSYIAKYDADGNQLRFQQIDLLNGSIVSESIGIDGRDNVYIVGVLDGSLPDNNNLGSDDAFIAKYDGNGTQLWTKQFGTSELDGALGISTDSSGNVYVTGYTEGSLSSNSNLGGQDVFIVGFDADGNLLNIDDNVWIRQFGTSSFDEGIGIITNANGNVYVTGGTYGSLSGNNNLGSGDAYIAEYDASGTQLWVKQFGSASSDIVEGISTDNNANVYVVGYTSGSLPGNSNSGANDAYIAKYDASGTQLWVKQFGSSDSDFAQGISTDSSGNVYVAGSTLGSLSGNSNFGDYDAYVAKYDADGTQVWIKQFGTSNFEYANGISSDNDGNVYVTGFTYGVLTDNSNSGLNDAYIAKYDASGNQVWIKQFGTSDFDNANGVSTDSSGNVYVTGYVGGRFIDGEVRKKDVFVAKYNASGNQVWIKQFGSSETDEANGISTDSNGNVYVTGYTEGSLLGNSNLGERDAFVAKYDASGNQIWVKQFGTSTTDEAKGISTDSNGNVYISGLTYGSLSGNSNLGSYDAFIVGFDADGNLLNPSNQSVLSINDLVIAEGDRGTTNATFTVTRTGTATNTVTVDYMTVDGTATAGSDYLETNGILTFAPNETSKTITVEIIGDLIPEDDETFFINLNNATNATVDKSQGVGTIVYPVPISDDLEASLWRITGDPLIIDGFVGALIDESDSYRLRIRQNSIVSIKLTNLSADADLFLEKGVNSIRIGSTQSGNTDEIITYGLSSGVHRFEVVSSPNTEGTTYKLEIKADPLFDFAGNTLDQARNIGVLKGTQTFTDFVGDVDRDDFYRFELLNNSQVNLGLSPERLGAVTLLNLLDGKGNRVDFSAANVSKNLEAGVYYAQVSGDNTNYNVTFSAIANASSPFQITSITPVVSSNSGESTITVKGSQFTTNSLVSIIAPDGTEVLAKSVKFQDQSTLTATFDLVGLTTGAYDVKVVDKAETAQTDDLFQVNMGNPGRLEVFISAPDGLRPWSTGEVVVTYRNSGNTNITSPLLTLTAEGGLFEDSEEYRDNTVQFLAINPQGDAGVLSPGATGTFSIRFRPENNADNISFAVKTLATSETVDWGAIQESSRPESIPSEAWAVIFNNFVNEVGGKAEKYEKVLAENATRLSELGEPTGDVSKLLAFELQQVNSQGIFERFNLGSFGRGFSNPWDITATANSDGDVTIQNGGSLRFFEKLGIDSYKAEAGDNGVITLENGVYRLQEQDGTVIAFRTDGKLDFVRDTNSNQVTAGYTTNKLTTLTYTNGDVITFAYNNQGRIDKVTDQFGQETTYTYDGTGERLLSVTDASGTISYTYEIDGAKANAIKSITFPDGTQTFFEYDEQGRVTKQSLNGGLESVTYGYDSAGGVTVTDAQGNVAKLLQNASGQVSRIEDALGRVTEFRYDETGNLTRIIAPENNLSSFNYDSRGNLLSATDSLGQRVEFIYDQQFDQIQTVQDQRGNDILYTYDAQGNLGQIIYADGSSEAFSYNSEGDVTVFVNRRGEDIDYTYDSRGLLTKKVFADGTQATFAYDSRGNLTQATDADSNVTYAYDIANRLTEVSYGTGRSLTFAYDAGGRRTQMVDQDGFTTNYSYDSVGRLAQLTDGDGANIITYSYDTVGRLAKEVNGNGTYTTYSYDAVSQLTSIVHYKADNSINSRFDYTYDSLGRRTSSTTLEGTTTYSYDATGQLTSVVLPDNNRTITYQYDAAGNRISVIDSGTNTTYDTNNLNQYTNVGDVTYTYDTDGNLIAKNQGSQTWTYSYDTENRLVGVVSSEGTWGYEYDALGKRIASIKDGQRTEYLLDPTGLGDVVGEYSSGNVARYTYGLGLVSRVDGSNSASFYDTDAIGSVVGLSGTSGSYLNSYSYLPFGEDLTKTETVANPFEFVGQYGVMDEGNGLDFMRARFYTPSEGRFMNPDPIGINGGINLYQYSVNNPVSFIDPTGETPLVALVIALTLVVPVVVTGVVVAGGYIKTLEAIEKEKEATQRYQVTGNEEDLREAEKYAGQAQLTSGITRFIADFGKPPNPFDRSTYQDYDPQTGTWTNKSGSPYLPTVPAGNFSANLPQQPNPLATSQTTVARPIDPNDIIGPSGFGDQNWLTPDQILPYTIRFENLPTATAAAVFVTITHTLDPDLDLTTFELGDFGFGDLYIDIPSGFQSYTTRLDLRDTIGDYVDFEASLDQNTRIVLWKLTTIDPATGQIPDDVDAGFLPPNNENHDGEGFVNYRITAKQNLTTGTRIDAEASIVFDTEAPINTPPIFNTIDVGQPDSAVITLPATVGQTFTITWGGSDDGSGIASYDIFVSVNGGTFTLWQDNITTTSATYNGEVGKTYSFYSVAKDNVGYTENAPLIGDTTVTVVASNNPPALSVINKSGNKNTVIAFTAADFSSAFSDPDNNSLSKIQITSLPNHGVLKLNNTDIFINQEISAIALNELTFTPELNFNGSVSFAWNGFDGTDYATNFALVNITVNAVNDTPTAVTLSNTVTELAENSDTTGGIKVADIAIADDSQGTNVLSLSGTDKDSFEIRNNALFFIGSSPDFETKNKYDVTVNVDDTSVGGTPDASIAFTLNITDINEVPVNNPPTAVTLSNTVTELAENSDTTGGIKVADIAIADDGQGTNVLSLSGTDKDSFEIRNNALFFIGSSPDFETKNKYDVTVNVDDTSVGGTPDASIAFTLNITDINEVTVNNPPTAVTLSNTVTELAENSDTTGGIKVADIAIADDGQGTNVLSLSGTDKDSFEIRNNALFFVGSSPDFETKNKYDVTVNVDDASAGVTPDASTVFTLTVTNLPDQNISEIVPKFNKSTMTDDQGNLTYDLISVTGNVTTQADDAALNQTDALFHNLVGLYQVENANGAIFDTLDLNGNGATNDLLNPGDAGYARTAITNTVNNFILQMGANSDPAKNTSAAEFGDVLLQGGKLYAPFAIANGGNLIPKGGTLQDGINNFLAQNPNNTAANLTNFMTHAVAYFSFGNANPDGTEHLQNRGNNVFGFEDLPGNLGVSDFDFNDAVFKFTFIG